MSSGVQQEAAAAVGPFRDRLIRFYTKYNQACLPSVDTILSTYVGREDELMRVLVSKYGPEPNADGSADATNDDDATPAASPDRLRGRSATLIDRPTASADTTATAAGRGRAATAAPRLDGPDPHFVTELHARLRRMIDRYDPPAYRAVNTDAMPVDEAASLLEALASRYGGEPPVDPTTQRVDWRLLLHDFMSARCPAELPKLDTLLRTFAGREREVYQAMQRRYPTDSGAGASSSTGTTTHAAAAAAAAKGKRHVTLSAEERAGLRARLERFYQHYQPSKVSNIEAILDAFRGSPDDLMAQIVEKYGPEPTQPPLASSTTATAGLTSQPSMGSREVTFDNAPSHSFGVVSSTTAAPSDGGNTATLAPPPPPAAEPWRSAATVLPQQQQQPPFFSQPLSQPAADMAELEQLGSTLPTPRGTPPPEARHVPSLLSTTVAAAPRPASSTGHAPSTPHSTTTAASAFSGTGKSRPIIDFPTTTTVTPGVVPALPRDATSPPRIVGAQEYNQMLAHVANTLGQGNAQAPQPTPRDWHTRIYQLYSFYRPDKLLHLGEKMAAHRGREAEWMALLLTKYGPEPPPRRPVRHTPAADEAFEGQLKALFSRHDPSMLPFVPLLLGDPSIARAEFLRDAQTMYASLRKADSRHVSPHLEDHVVRGGPRARPSASILAGLRSPSMDRHQEGQQGHGTVIDIEGPSTVAELEAAVRDLAVALDEKTNELEAMVTKLRQATDDRDMLESKAHELSARNSEVELENAKLREMVRLHTSQADELIQLRTQVDLLKGQIEREGMQLTQATSTVAIREHQNRVLRMQMQQLSEEIGLRDEKIKVALQSQQALADSLSERLKDVSALQLDLTPTSDPERFYTVVDEIQAAFKTHYDERIAADEAEMREYYQYAETQISNREAIIEELLNALSATVRPGITNAASALHQAENSMHNGSEDEAGHRRHFQQQQHQQARRSRGGSRSPGPDLDASFDAEGGGRGSNPLSEEVARLRVQVRMQEAEHSALLQAMALRQSASQVQPPPVHLNGSLQHDAAVQQLQQLGPSRADVLEESRAIQLMKRKLQEQEAAAKAKQAALAAELQQHMHDVGRLNDRLQMLEHERAVEAQRARDLEDRLRSLGSNTGTAANSGAAAAASTAAQGSLMGGNASAPLSPAREAELRAARALDMSEKLLEAAGRRVVPTSSSAADAAANSSSIFTPGAPASSSPPSAALQAQASLLTESSRNLEQYFASARGAPDPHQMGPTSSASGSASLPPWRTAAATAPLVALPQAKTAWGLMYGADAAGS